MGDNGPTEDLVRRAVEREREACAAMLDERARLLTCEASAAHLCGNVPLATALQALADANTDAAAAIRRRGD